MYKRKLLFLILLSFTLKINIVFAQFTEFSNSFDIITTIAGRGGIDDKGYNGWSSDYENALATEAELSRPHMAMADMAGNIYIADKDAHAIRKVDLKGNITTVAGTNIAGDNGDGIAEDCQLSSPNGIWVNRKGEFYILDLGNNKIRKVDTEGYMSTIIHDTLGISFGRGLWLCATEDTIWYSSNTEIRQWTLSSGITTLASAFIGLGNISQDINGNIIATDRLASKVFNIDKLGNKTHIAGNGNEFGDSGVKAIDVALYEVRGIWCLSDGAYLLATHKGSQIWYVGVDAIAHVLVDGMNGDEFHTGDGEQYNSPGYKISEPRAVSVDYEGNILITENDRGFIRKIHKKVSSKFDNRIKLNGEQLSIFPNPVLDVLTLKCTFEEDDHLEATLYNQLGELITIFVNEKVHAGNIRYKWERANTASGIYFLKITTNKKTTYQKIMLR